MEFLINNLNLIVAVVTAIGGAGYGVFARLGLNGAIAVMNDCSADNVELNDLLTKRGLKTVAKSLIKYEIKEQVIAKTFAASAELSEAQKRVADAEQLAARK